ncbi:MAG TPA: right-handed parallel beta-helix repeat-containing protein, partial [Candidatus Limnocylindrales bacterium]|nr:right-handed parallel beta-helix repeat-containing protein [Candidatus Limnocylindrales bacterium]
MARLIVGALGATIALLAGALPGRALEIGPDTDYCAMIKTLKPGEELVLRPGDYHGPCAIRRGGTPGAPIVIRAQSPEHRPRIVYEGRSTNVLEVRTSHVVIRGLEFGPTQTDVDAVRIFGGSDITVEGCRFTGLRGIAVVANHNSVQGLTVRRNEILDSTTAMYFGCHDGQWCEVGDLLVERNYIRRVTAPDPYIGYGIQLKLNTAGIVRDNVVVDTKGPGIMVYGATDGRRASVVERNLVIGSRQSAGIVVGGGPAVVRNNIVVDNATAGIALEDYRKRGLLRGVRVLHNTAYRNGGPGILLPDAGPLEAIIANNAVAARAGIVALPGPRAGAVLEGNVDCSAANCFAAPDERDFSPVAGSPVSRSAGAGGAWVPE